MPTAVIEMPARSEPPRKRWTREQYEALSSLGIDLTTKAARAGILDYSVLHITGRRMFVHRDPQSGRYLSVAACNSEESVPPPAASGSPFRMRDTFPE